MFGSTSFTNQPTSTFGNFTAAANTTAPGLFGQTQQTTAMPLFGGTNTTTAFNTPMKQTTFGSTFGSTPSNVVTPIFGAAQPNRMAPVSATTGIFSNPATTITPFSQGQAQGTSIPFNPLSGSDTMMRNGQPSPIGTRHQCITCMKEYENKSLEELRIEDYQLGRKGSAQAGLFGGTVTQQPSSIFSGLGSSATPAFGQQRTTTFGTPATSTGLFSNLNQSKPPGLFSSTNTGTTFGTPTFSFPTTTTQSSGLLFNQPSNTTATTAAPFSFTPQPQTQMNLFNTKPLAAPATTTTTFTGFNNTMNKPLGGIFASTASAPFGTTNTLGTSTAAPSLFSQPTQSKPFQPFSFNAPSTQSFGQTSTSTFSFSTPTTTTSGISFGSTPAPIFGSVAPTTGFSFNPNPTAISLGAPTTTTTTFPSFSFSNQPQQQPSTGFSFFNNPTATTNTMQATNLQPTPQPAGSVPFATTPYKDSALFYNVIMNRSLEDMTKPTNPLAQRAVDEAAKRRSSSHFSSSASPSTLGNLTFSASRNSSYSAKQYSIFDGFEEDNSASATDVLSPKSSIKKLSLKDIPGLSEPAQVQVPTVPKFASTNLNDSTRTSSSRNRFSSRGGDYSISNIPGESASMASPTAANSEGQHSHSQEPQSEQSKSTSGTPSTQESIRNFRNRPREYNSNVKCTRSGYYTEPTLEEMDAVTDSDGHCRLDSFIVGRHKFGRIKFLERVDVAGLNLDDLVHFRHKETVVYPDDSVKPPVGEGINVPAEITMERIWPVDKYTKEPIKSPSEIKALNYEDKLRRSCKRMDAHFISYDAELGEWTFRVKHFSKYTCEPEENEESKVETLPPAKPREERIGLGGVHVGEHKSASQTTPTKQGLEKTSSTGFPMLKEELKETNKFEFQGYPYPKGIPSPVCGESENGMDDTDTDEDIEFNPLTPSECESVSTDNARDDIGIESGREPLFQSVLAGRATSPKIGLMRSVLDFDENVDEISMDVHPPAKKSRPPHFPSSKRMPEPHRGRKESDSMFAQFTPKNERRTGKFPEEQDLDFALPVTHAPPAKSIIRYSEVGATRERKDLDFTLAAKSVSSYVKRPPITSMQLTPGGMSLTSQKGLSHVMEAGDDIHPRQLLQQLTLHEPLKEDRFGQLIKPRKQVRKVIKRRQLLLAPVQRPLDLFAPLTEESTCVPCRPIRCGRVGFGPNGHFLQILNTRSTKPGGFVGEVNVMRLQPQFETLETERTPVKAVTALRSQLKMQRESSELVAEGQFASCPFGNVALHAEVLKGLSQKTTPRNMFSVNELLEEEEHMWDLCKILWPAEQVEKNFTGKFDRRTCYDQRQAFSQWLSSDGVGLFRDSARDNSVNALVRRGQKLKACEEAVEQNSCSLALCLAQNSYDAKETCDSQMVKWEMCAAEEFLSPELKELYQVCSGCPIWNRLNLRQMTSSEWLQHFVIYNRYLAPINQSISRVIEMYHQFIKMAIRPVGCDTSDLSFPAEEEATMANLCINLLKAYSCSGYPVAKLLAPISHGPDVLDYKISWLLMNNLIRFGFEVDAELFNSVSTSFAGQLETLGYYEWAVFVLQHCDPCEERTCLIKRIVERNLLKSYDVRMEKFVSSLGGNAAILWDAKVVAAVANKSSYDEVWFLLKSGRYNEAYRVFVTKYRKDFLSPTKISSTFSLLEEMAKIAPRIHEWEGYGGALYNLLQAVKGFSTGLASSRERIYPTLPQTVASFGRICPKDAVDLHIVIAMGVMVKYLLQVIVDHPPVDNMDLIGQIKVLQFPSPSPDMERFPRRLEEYFKKLRFNEHGIQTDTEL